MVDKKQPATSTIWTICYITIGLITACSSENMDRFAGGTWIDLSHSYEEATPYWPTASGFQLDTVFAGFTPGGWYYSAFEFKSSEHGGTHIDAPIHFAEKKQTVDNIPLDRLIGEAIVIDVRDSCADYIDYQIQISDLMNFEKQHGKIPDGSILLLHTGISKFWPDRLQYMGTNKLGAAAVAMLHFPGLHPDAATWLVNSRKIAAIGLDTPSIDFGRSSDFRSHRILMKENIPAFENVANLDLLPATGAYVVALPMKIKGGSGGPLRIVAHVPG